MAAAVFFISVSRALSSRIHSVESNWQVCVMNVSLVVIHRVDAVAVFSVSGALRFANARSIFSCIFFMYSRAQIVRATIWIIFAANDGLLLLSFLCSFHYFSFGLTVYMLSRWSRQCDKTMLFCDYSFFSIFVERYFFNFIVQKDFLAAAERLLMMILHFHDDYLYVMHRFTFISFTHCCIYCSALIIREDEKRKR